MKRKQYNQRKSQNTFKNRGIEAVIETIDKEKALRLLQVNEKNRNISKVRRDYLADLMVNGYWKLNGESILIQVAPNGDQSLIDGQHRLSAVVSSDTKIDFLVTYIYSEDPSLIASLGQCKARTLADVLKMNNAEKPGSASATITKITQYENNRLSFGASVKVNNEEGLIFYNQNKELLDEAVSLGYSASLQRICIPSTMSMAYFVCAGIHHEMAYEFYNRLKNMENFNRFDPVGALYSGLQGMVDADMKRRTKEQKQYVYIVKAWNAYRKGKPLNTLRWWPNREEIPRFE